MALLFCDASARIKRYLIEVGSDVMNAVFAHAAPHRMPTTPWGYTETYSLLRRRYNGGVIDRATFTVQVSALQAEVVHSPDFGLVPITGAAIFASVFHIEKHSLNATDAAILTMLLEFAQLPGAPRCVVIAADQRLLRAAAGEGLLTLDPQQTAAAGIPAFLGGF